MLRVIIAVLAALIISLLITPLTKKPALKLGASDEPGGRKVHTKVMTRLGGLGIYCGFVVGFIIYGDFSREMVGLLISASFITAVGMVDDCRDISPKLKLVGQIAAALILIGFGVRLEYITIPFSGVVVDCGFWGYPLTLLWLVGVCNAVNLIDGLDGLAGGISIIATLTIGVVAYNGGIIAVTAICLYLAGAVAGFLKWNFHPATLFMGDCGSLLLGFLLASLSLMSLAEGATVIALAVPILILAVPILDTLFAIIRRLINHKPVFQADKNHFHHRLMARGLNHGETVLLIYGVTFLFGAVAVLITMLPAVYGIISGLIAVCLVLLGAVRLGLFRLTEEDEDKPVPENPREDIDSVD